MGRVRGANFACIYGKTKAMGYRNVTLPKGHTWKFYTLFLLDTLPARLRNKRMCYCILKNDHICRFMGFGMNREQQKRIDAIKAKYKSVEDMNYGV